eukprot:SAG31_NODE_904_length_11120_cov_76.575084_8_plen_71_part_00
MNFLMGRGKKRKLVLYVLFLVVFVVVCFGIRPVDLNYQNGLVESAFKLSKVDDIKSWSDVDIFVRQYFVR